MFNSLLSVSREDSKDVLHKVPSVTLDVEHLSYTPPTPSLLNRVRESIVWSDVAPQEFNDRLRKKLHSEEDAELVDVSFRALPGKFTAVISHDNAERHTLMELISGRRKYGEFDGEVTLLESNSLRSNLTVDSATAYVPREAVSLYMPGLSYLEMVTYAARLRMIGSTSLLPGNAERVIALRVNEVMEMMNLTWCKDRIITERPTSRGSLGGELRRMAIACEIVCYAPVLVFDDITSDLDEHVSNEILECLSVLAMRGHTVVASFKSPHVQSFEVFHTVVLLSTGRSIYSSTVDNIYRYFCEDSKFKYSNPSTGDSHSEDVGRFLLDIANGTERPHGLRYPPCAADLHACFEASQYFPKSIGSDSSWDSHGIVSLLHDNSVSYLGVLLDCDWEVAVQQAWIQFKRALYLKFRETDILKKLFMASVILSLVFGYIVFDITSTFDYCMSLLGFPYPEVMTLTGCLYVFHVVPFGMSVVNAHVFHQKLQVFLFERRGKWVSTLGYLVSSVVPELLFALSYTAIYANIVYWMSSLNEGWEAYKYYMCVMLLVSALSVWTLLVATAFFKNEIAVRNFFVFTLSVTVMTSGMMFTFPVMRPVFQQIATSNPFRWTFSGLMVWMWDRYPDGPQYLHSYELEGFDKDSIWGILVWFFLIDFVVYLYLILPERNSLCRKETIKSEATDRLISMESDVDDVSLVSQRSMNSHLVRGSSGLLKPEFLSRESSFSASQILSKKTSSFGNNDFSEDDSRGPRVSFVDLAYRVADNTSPLGRKEVLHKMSGRFEWGKLSAIMGAEGAGKSSLLHIIGGQKLSSGAELSGKIYYNDKSIDDGRLKSWQKCAYIEAQDTHFRDLTIGQVISYALELRNEDSEMSNEDFERTVEQTLVLLQLTDRRNTKCKYLSAGEIRRLSIAEELVVGPMLVLIDEPVTGLDARESSIILTQTLREVVNQDRTVVCTMHQPTAAVFELFDTLVLLSKGRLIYIGPANKAVNYFITSPTLDISNSSYKNPAEFLFAVSAGFVTSDDGTNINSEALERHYFDSSAFGYYNGMETFRSTDKKAEQNDLTMDERSDNTEWRCASFDGTAPDSFVRRSMNYSKAIEKPSYWELIFLQYYVPLLSFVHDLAHINFVANCRRGSILLRRASRTLFQRPRMLVVSTLTHFVTSLFIVYVVTNNQENNAAVITPAAAFGGFLLMMINIQFAFYLFNNQKVFLREHSRGLYSTFLRWLVEPLPLLLLRSFHAFIWASTLHFGYGLQGGDVGIYFYLMTWFMCLACTMIIETICYTLKDIRDVYGAIIGTALTLFLFSGLFFKPATFPSWMAPWLPSISIIRWYSQGIINNEFDDNLHAFPVIPLPTGDLSLYQMYLSAFGWGGKSKWFSFRCVVMNLIGFRVLQLIVCWKTTVSQRGERCFLRKEMTIDKIY